MYQSVALLTTQEKFAFTVFERTFKEFGLPQVMRTDNGVPFAPAHAIYGLSKLALWWLRLGIQIERIKPGHPQQNGRRKRIRPTSRVRSHYSEVPLRERATGARFQVLLEADG